MEQNQQIQRLQQDFKPVSQLQEIQLASQTKLIGSCEDEEIKQVLRYIFVLIGLRKELIPSDDLSKAVLLNFIKKRLLNVPLEEIRLSFEYAVEKRTEVNLTLFGDTFSSKTIVEVLEAYRKYKKSIINSQPKENDFTTGQRVSGLIDILKSNPEGKKTLDMLKNIGKVPEKEIKKRPELTEYEKLQQDILREFDELHSRVEYERGTRVIEYNGKTLTQSEFLEIRLSEMWEI